MKTLTWSQVYSVVKKCDLVLEVVDSRDPIGTRSRGLERIVRKLGKKLLIVINKADLVPKRVLEGWKEVFEAQGYPTIYISAKMRRGTRLLRETILEHSLKTPVIVAVIGFPKVGKSTIINVLKGKKSASTSPIPGSPGYTRHVQLYRVDDKIKLLDTPGILPVSGEGLEAALKGKPPEEFKDPVKPAVELLRVVLEKDPTSIYRVYKVDSRDPYEVLNGIAVRRGWFYRSTGEPNIEEAARTVLRDWHRSKITFYVKPEEYIQKITKDKNIKKYKK